MAEFLENEIQEDNLVWNSITYKGIIVKLFKLNVHTNYEFKLTTLFMSFKIKFGYRG